MRWNWLKLRRNLPSARLPRSRASYRPVVEALEVRLVPSADVLSYHNDLGRTGANLNETILTPSNVNSTNFGKLFTYNVDGQVYASPLYKSNVTIAGMGTFNVAYVATEHDSVYAFDTDSNTSGPSGNGILWKDSFINPAMGINVVLSGDVGCGQISPEIGITGTPVIDPAAGTIYLEAMTKQGTGASATYHQTLYALDITTGNVTSSVEISASVPGTGDGGSIVNFIPKNYKERDGLVLLNGVVYTAWASHCDFSPSHGWVIGYDAQTLQQTSVFCTSPNGQLDTIWGGSGSLAVDSDGNIYFETGNGSYNPGAGNYSESFVQLSTAGGGLSVADYFTPYNYAALDAADRDLGSGAPIVLPDQPGAHPHLLVGSGKEGTIYLIDRDTMGHLVHPGVGPDDNIVQELHAALGPGVVGGSWDTPAYFDGGAAGRWIYYVGNGNNPRAFSLTNGLLSTSPSSQSPTNFSGSYGATPVISANGTTNGIMWALENSGGHAVLHAYDALNLATELYNSNLAGARDQLAAGVKFATPSIADGKVFVGTSNTLTIFGSLRPVFSPVPDQTIASSQQTLDVSLTVANPTTDPLTFMVTAQSLAYVVTQQTGTLTYDSTLDNIAGLNEKWLYDPAGQYYYILPTGELFVGSSGASLGVVGISYYNDPTLLTDPPPDPHAIFSFTGSTLTITRDLDWIGSMVITVMVDNGHGSDSITFNLFVTP